MKDYMKIDSTLTMLFEEKKLLLDHLNLFWNMNFDQAIPFVENEGEVDWDLLINTSEMMMEVIEETASKHAKVLHSFSNHVNERPFFIHENSSVVPYSLMLALVKNIDQYGVVKTVKSDMEELLDTFKITKIKPLYKPDVLKKGAERLGDVTSILSIGSHFRNEKIIKVRDYFDRCVYDCLKSLESPVLEPGRVDDGAVFFGNLRLMDDVQGLLRKIKSKNQKRIAYTEVFRDAQTAMPLLYQNDATKIHFNIGSYSDYLLMDLYLKVDKLDPVEAMSLCCLIISRNVFKDVTFTPEHSPMHKFARSLVAASRFDDNKLLDHHKEIILSAVKFLECKHDLFKSLDVKSQISAINAVMNIYDRVKNGDLRVSCELHDGLADRFEGYFTEKLIALNIKRTDLDHAVAERVFSQNISPEKLFLAARDSLSGSFNSVVMARARKSRKKQYILDTFDRLVEYNTSSPQRFGEDGGLSDMALSSFHKQLFQSIRMLGKEQREAFFQEVKLSGRLKKDLLKKPPVSMNAFSTSSLSVESLIDYSNPESEFEAFHLAQIYRNLFDSKNTLSDCHDECLALINHEVSQKNENIRHVIEGALYTPTSATHNFKQYVESLRAIGFDLCDESILYPGRNGFDLLEPKLSESKRFKAWYNDELEASWNEDANFDLGKDDFDSTL